MPDILIPAADFCVPPGVHAEARPGGLRILGDAQGGAAIGPSLAVESGLYQVSVNAALVRREGRASGLEVWADGTLLCVREYRAPFEVVIFITSTQTLEIRFVTHGAPVDLDGVKVHAIWLAASPPTASSIHQVSTLLAEADVEPATVRRLSQEYAAWSEAQAAEALRRQAMEATPASRVRRLWGALHTPGASFDGHDASALSARQIAPVAATELLNTFDMYTLNGEDRTKIVQMGYLPQALEATWRHRSSREGPRQWQHDDRGPEGATPDWPRGDMFRRTRECDLSFQFALARGEGMTAYCPITGAELISKHGFVVVFSRMTFVFYRFEGAEVFYVCAGEATGGRSFIYIPRSSSVFLLMDPIVRWYPKAEIIYRFWMAIISDISAVRAYLATSPRPAAVISNNNMGHFIWNDLNGIHCAIGVGLAPKLAAICKIPDQFLPIEEVFPEIDEHLIREISADGAMHEIMQAGLLPIRFTDAVFDSAFASRLASAATYHPRKVSTHPLVWINLRAHTKVWVEQVAGYAYILNALAKDYGAVEALLDGWMDCTAAAAEIRSLVDPGVTLHDGIGFGVLESIGWALAVDAYACTIGSGLVLVTWIAAKEGVAHAERAHMQQMEWWSDVRPGAPAPITPPLDAIQDVDAGPFGIGLYCNYHLDPALVLAALRSILDKRFVRLRPK